MKETTPLFVKLEKQEEILEIVEVINKKLEGVKKIITEFEELKAKEEEELASWNNNLQEISQKIELMKKELTGEQ